MVSQVKPPVPPFTEETARAKVKAAENAWNTRDPEVVASAYTEDSQWRNRDEFFTGREAVLVAAGLVASSESLWPDVIVGIAIAILFLHTATFVLRESLAEISRARGGVIEGTAQQRTALTSTSAFGQQPSGHNQARTR